MQSDFKHQRTNGSSTATYCTYVYSNKKLSYYRNSARCGCRTRSSQPKYNLT